ncbi:MULTISPECIES: CocE/NonD family hydrolase C-terminal non-catalytic domain-containing protein [Streptomyces]|uniref:CocE/NonD family hydrolase C-terminal non-catalytic domain-containing protein n=1 Tax=Streptomyces sp. 900129855 TaxID=3155129 RepID=A0ABV2ZY94_9ACTN
MPSALAYAGPLGRICASHRALDAEKSMTLEPYLSHEREDLVEPGIPVQLDLGLWPTGMLIHPGEILVLEIAGHFTGPLTPPRTGQAGPDTNALATRNAGTNTIGTGGRFDSPRLAARRALTLQSGRCRHPERPPPTRLPAVASGRMPRGVDRVANMVDGGRAEAGQCDGHARGERPVDRRLVREPRAPSRLPGHAHVLRDGPRHGRHAHRAAPAWRDPQVVDA